MINMVATESAENYLEAILVLSKEKPVVRSVDVVSGIIKITPLKGIFDDEN